MLKISINLIAKHPDMPQVDNKYREAGARKSIIVFAAEGVDENYFNLSQAINLIELNNEEFKMSMDLKCLSILIGIQSQSSRYPCTYCHSAYDSKNGVWIESSEERTFEGIEFSVIN